MFGKYKHNLYLLSILTIFVVCFSGLVIFAYRGYYTRYFADDYCLALDTFNRNVFQYIDWGFRTIAGRFSFLFVFWLAAQGGLSMAQYLPFILLSIWLMTTYWAVLPWAQWLIASYPRLFATMLSCLLVFSCLAAMPDLDESFYWMTGALVYTLPIIAFTVFGGLLTRILLVPNFNIVLAICATFITCLTAGALSDMFSGIQLIVLALMWFVVALITWRSKSTTAWRVIIVLTVGLLGALISFIIVLQAPSTVLRFNYFPQTLTYGRIILRSLNWSLKLSLEAIRNYGIIYLSVLLLPAFLIFLARSQQKINENICRNRKIVLQVGIVIVVFTYLITLACNGLSVYSTTTGPISRTVAIPTFFWVIGCIGLGSVIGLLFPFQRLPVLAIFVFVIMLCVSPLLNIRSVAAHIQPAQTRASMFDLRDSFLRASRAKNNQVEYIALNKYPRRFGDTYPGDDFAELWVRDCAARFYGFYNLFIK